LIAEQKLQFDTINFQKICTQIRLFISNEQSNYISKRGKKITFSFPEKDINITSKEYELYSKYKDKEDIIRTIVGITEDLQNNIYPERINFENKKSSQIFFQEGNIYSYQNSTNNQIFLNNYASQDFSLNQFSKNSETFVNQNTNIFNNIEELNYYQENLKHLSLNNSKYNDIFNMGIISKNGNIQNLLLNTMYSNLIRNISSHNNAG